MRKSLPLVAGVLAAPHLALAAPAAPAGVITVTVPRLSVAEYHRPYVAGWIEPAGGGQTRTLWVWYDIKKVGREPGTKWLGDLRSWWRKGGRSLGLPADGLSGQTRAPGAYRIPLPAGLRPGAYTLFVEAARETGGRELVQVPFSVPAKPAPAGASGRAELGQVTVSLR
ncbi:MULTISPECIES: DUF2271 domain-containing protein [unclassified Novosphingobium]|uniref:DUF2271 domain-containing protein n=1 Tax=unclassified Novosphingobium TaxID=2644732 RepID=UPI001494CE7E|nr:MULTISPECIES: DUF2271 domain-containing protein [unclassified Novosphingobium]MBB3360046.1 hypothetical protein [Novosphingobium sp. BK256]MBB3376465.1 hypothetical protein [Novosphingobium sp. BK280]MBB3380819.1 hypothetical protein [Novosphingobium sp. BK258]MBB3422529.1 hypothetical protein [Novosphingobium sp. BK267]MBB3451170.1 hypothetical protein [Novosphingobium sp. BK352]